MGEDYHMSGEAASRTNINIPGIQTELIKALRQLCQEKKNFIINEWKTIRLV